MHRDCCHGLNLVIRRAVGRRLAPHGMNDEDDGKVLEARDGALRPAQAASRGAGAGAMGPVVMGIIARGSEPAAVAAGQHRLDVGGAAAAAAAAGGGGGGDGGDAGGGGGGVAAAPAVPAQPRLGRGRRTKVAVVPFDVRDEVAPAPRVVFAEEAAAGPAVVEGEFTPAEEKDHLASLVEFLAVTSDEVLEHAPKRRIVPALTSIWRPRMHAGAVRVALRHYEQDSARAASARAGAVCNYRFVVDDVLPVPQGAHAVFGSSVLSPFTNELR